MDVLSLLKSKNKCIERFLEVNRRFYRIASQGDFAQIHAFEAQRNAIIRSMEIFDSKIEKALEGISRDEIPPQHLRAMKLLELEREEKLREVIRLDNVILDLVEDESKRLNQEMRVSRSTRETVGKFKSKWVANSGEGLDRKL